MTRSGPFRILLIYDCIYPESLGGVEHRNYRLAQALAGRGHHATLAGWAAADPEPLPRGVGFLPMAFRSELYDKNGRRRAVASLKFALACCLLDVRGYDAVETANIPYAHLFPLALRCALSGRPLIVTWYEYFGSYWRSYKGPLAAAVFMAVEWISAQIGTTVTSTSVLTAKRLEKRRWRSGPVHLIGSGVSLEDIRRAALDKLPGPPLLYAGRLIGEKRIDLLLEAAALINRTGEDPLLGIVGDGPDRTRLENLAARLGLADRVRFLGRLPRSDDVWRLLASARIAVQPSAREGFGMFPLEAMALGIPVVYCEAEDNAIGDIVRDGIEGICARAEPQALADAILALMNDDDLRERLGAQGAHRAELYDWPSIARQIEAVCS
jgi:glycosyltransferase involved in cell wall biosynthesis